ncbi:MAG: hypothetical protein V7742_05460 [Halioglobus sp.]
MGGCTRGESNVEKGNREGILHVGNGAEPQALDHHTFEITLNEPAPYFLSALAHYTLLSVHQPTIEKFIELTYNTAKSHQKVAIAIQQMWKDTLNIEVTFQHPRQGQLPLCLAGFE